MLCPKCRRQNAPNVRFCTSCHATLQFICPSCKCSQDHGGKCDRCGVDFAKYAAMIGFQMAGQERRKREQAKSRNQMAKQLLLTPLTGGWSLLRYVKTALRGE